LKGRGLARNMNEIPNIEDVRSKLVLTKLLTNFTVGVSLLRFKLTFPFKTDPIEIY